jgi:uncharacterized protein (DUF1786 family)
LEVNSNGVSMPFLNVDSANDGNVQVEMPGLNVKCAPTDHGTTKCTSSRLFRTREVSPGGTRTSPGRRSWHALLAPKSQAGLRWPANISPDLRGASPLQYEAPTVPQPGAAAQANAKLAEVSDPSQTTEVTMPFLHVVSNDDGNVHVELPGLNIKCAPTDHGTTKCTSARPFRTREVSIAAVSTITSYDPVLGSSHGVQCWRIEQAPY